MRQRAGAKMETEKETERERERERERVERDAGEVLQVTVRVAVCGSVLQSVAECCSVW